MARIFNVDDGLGTMKTVAISGLTLTGGDVASILGGGAISNQENLTVTALTITGNSAGSTTTGYHGGGIVNFGGNLAVNASTISGNTVLFGRGGGIYSTFGTLTISRSTISENFVSSTGKGGGVYSSYATTTIDSSTISGNEANSGGGLVQTGIGRLMTITNSTISDNSAGSTAAGWWRCSATLTCGTVRLPTTEPTRTTMAAARGEACWSGRNSARRRSLTSSSRGMSGDSSCATTWRARWRSVSVCWASTPGHRLRTRGAIRLATQAPIDPLLSGLTDNGGLTKTHELLPGARPSTRAKRRLLRRGSTTNARPLFARDGR